MPPAPEPEAPSVRLFASVDLIGSTAFKNQVGSEAAGYRNRVPPWAETFRGFYWGFARTLHEVPDQHGDSAQSDGERFVLFKSLGDELIFTQTIRRHGDAVRLSTRFRNALRAYNSSLGGQQLGLRVKGTLWIAGFPINNTQIADPRLGDGLGGFDYLGPSMDAGFRLAKHASKRRLQVSVDLALLLTVAQTSLTFFFDGMEPLRGVLGDRPYPLIWIESDEDDIEQRLQGIDRRHCDYRDLHQFCDNYLASCQSPPCWLIKPYLADDPRFQEQPAWHRQIYAEWAKEGAKQSAVTTGSAPADTDPVAGTAITESSITDAVVRFAPSAQRKKRRRNPAARTQAEPPG